MPEHKTQSEASFELARYAVEETMAEASKNKSGIGSANQDEQSHHPSITPVVWQQD